MKTILFIPFVLGLFSTPCLHSQSDSDNLYKYWNYRYRLVKDFVFVGKDPGNSLPASARRIAYPYGSQESFLTTPGSMYWQDATIYLSHYIEVLSTEYRLLANSGYSTGETLNELYYALSAINRLDKWAEYYLSKQLQPVTFDDLNGLFLRDNVGEGTFMFLQSKSEDDFSLVFGRLLNLQYIHSDYFQNQDNPAVTYNRINVMSLDQILAIMTALLFVDELVDPIIVQPTESDDPMNLVEEAENITARIINYLNENDWRIRRVPFQDLCENNDVANLEGLVCNGNSCRMFSYPIAETASRILEQPVCPLFCQARDRIEGFGNSAVCDALSLVNNLEPLFVDWQTSHCNELETDDLDVNVPIGAYSTLWEAMELLNIEYTSNWGTEIESLPELIVQGEFCLPSYNPFGNEIITTCTNIDISIGLDALAKPFDDDNVHMIYEAATASNIWNGLYVNNLSNASGIYHMPLMHAVLNNGMEPYEWMFKGFYKENFIDEAPCTGPYAHPYILEDNSGPVWASSNKLFHFNHMENGPINAEGQIVSAFRGEFSGLDYMLYYNLYHLLWPEELPTYKRFLSCECVHEVTEELALSNALEIKRKFPDYQEKKIPIESFLAHSLDVTTSSGVVDVKNDLIICNSDPAIQTVLHVKNDARLNLYANQTITVREGNEIRITDNAQFHAGIAEQLGTLEPSTVVLEENAALVIESASLLMEGGLHLIMKPGSRLEITSGSCMPLNANCNGIYLTADHADIVLDHATFVSACVEGSLLSTLVESNLTANHSTLRFAERNARMTSAALDYTGHTA